MCPDVGGFVVEAENAPPEVPVFGDHGELGGRQLFRAEVKLHKLAREGLEGGERRIWWEMKLTNP